MDDEATEEDSFESAELEENSEESRWEDFFLLPSMVTGQLQDRGEAVSGER